MRSNIHTRLDLYALVGLIAHADVRLFHALERELERGLVRHEIDDEEVVRAIASCPAHFASGFTGTLNGKLTINETMQAADVPNLSSSDPALQFALGVVESITGVTAIASMSQALTAGAATIDFTALTHRGNAVTFNGLKTKYAAFNKPTGAVATLSKGAANGLALLGAAFNLALQPGDYSVHKLTASTTVDATHKNVDVAGTGAETVSLLVAGG